MIDLEVATRPVLETLLAEDFVTIRREVRDKRVLGVSHFGWIGNHYRCIGSPAPPATERWWRRLRRWVQRVATPVTPSGPPHGPGASLYAFPAALAAIRGGMARSAY